MGRAARLFRRHVGGRAEQLALDRHRHLARFAFGQTEVHQVRFARRVEHDVRRLEVTMNHTVVVGVLQGVGQRRAQLGRFARRGLLVGRANRPDPGPARIR